MLKSLKQFKYLAILIILVVAFGMSIRIAHADNPIITTDYYADPSCRVFNGTMYIYGSHDINNTTWFKMRDYHVWSSTNGVKWTDSGVVLDKSNVPWLDQNQDSMWAPDCVYKNGTYYLFFPANDKNNTNRIGVATSSSPTGPFTAQSSYLANVIGIDPCIYIDDTTGDAYMYWGTNASPYYIMVAKLNPDLLSLATTPTAVSIQGISSYSLIEGPWVHKYNGKLYLSVPVSYSGNEVMDYAIGTSPTGPFTYKGRIFDANNIYTIHGSIVNYNNHWYAFYHDATLTGSGYGRSWRAEEFQYNADGTIPKLTKTIRGIGTANAYDQIQVDRYNSASSGIQYESVGGGEPTGWNVGYISNGSWIQYNNVDFTSTSPDTVYARVASPSGGGSIEVRVDSTTGTLLGTISIPTTGGYQTWTTVSANLTNIITGVHNLFLVFRTGSFNVNWVQFASSSTPPSGNLIINPDFETGNTNGWAVNGAGSIAVSGAQKHSGSYSLYHTGRTATWNGPLQNLTSIVQNGKTYTCSGWVRLDNATSGTVIMTVKKVDGSGTTYTNVTTGTGSNSSWVQLSGSYALNVSGTLTELSIYFEGPASGINYYVDDVSVQ
jgi:arabinoxylan arabinofuranohydrolase